MINYIGENVDKKRVLIVTRSLNVGGIEAQRANVIKHVNRDQFKVTVLVFNNRSDEIAYYEETIRACGVMIVKLFAGENKYLQYIKRRRLLAAHLKENQYDVVHIHGCFVDDGIDCWIASRFGVPNIVMQAHTANVQWQKKHWRHFITHYIAKIYPPANHYATNYCACSQEAAQWMFGSLQVHGKSVEIIPNGIDYADFIFQESVRNEMREKFGLESKLVIGHVGRLSEAKNHSFLLEIFKQISIQRADTFLLMVGSGPNKSEIEKRINSLGLGNRVLLLDSSWQVSVCLQAMDAFVMPSLYEGFGTACVEAQAAGLPTFISDMVSKDTIISSMVWQISLRETAEQWGKKILAHVPNKDRLKGSGQLSDSKLNILNTTKQFEEIWLQ